jgi:hypothetical protein
MSVSFLVILCWLAIGGITSYFAQKRDRNPFLWFFIGVFLGVLGILILFLLPHKKNPRVAPAPVMASSAYSSPAAPEDFPTELSTQKKRLSANPKIHWYFIDKNKMSQGPLKLEEIKAAYNKGLITSDTLLWNEELEYWAQLKDFSNYDFLLDDTLKS